MTPCFTVKRDCCHWTYFSRHVERSGAVLRSSESGTGSRERRRRRVDRVRISFLVFLVEFGLEKWMFQCLLGGQAILRALPKQ
mmetsp:Transcript_806/g.1723  ORF Transcript_806/g.1723 Transcript_806/m.1723 type:complete len:83 (-) Transcript_806:856-1104(-)